MEFPLDAELVAHLTAAASLCHQALDLLPATAVRDRAVAHQRLGHIYRLADEASSRRVGDIRPHQLDHYQRTIRYAEKSGDHYAGGVARYYVALMLKDNGRLTDARSYAEAALDNFRQFGDRAANTLRETEALLAMIDAEISKSGGQP